MLRRSRTASGCTIGGRFSSCGWAISTRTVAGSPVRLERVDGAVGERRPAGDAERWLVAQRGEPGRTDRLGDDAADVGRRERRHPQRVTLRVDVVEQHVDDDPDVRTGLGHVVAGDRRPVRRVGREQLEDDRRPTPRCRCRRRSCSRTGRDRRSRAPAGRRRSRRSRRRRCRGRAVPTSTTAIASPSGS